MKILIHTFESPGTAKVYDFKSPFSNTCTDLLEIQQNCSLTGSMTLDIMPFIFFFSVFISEIHCCPAILPES